MIADELTAERFGPSAWWHKHADEPDLMERMLLRAIEAREDEGGAA